MYSTIARPILFRSDPEESHDATAPMLRGDFPMSMICGYCDVGKKQLSINLAGKVSLDGPIGLAAGFDKDASMLQGLSNIFDYVTFGTALPYPWPGNPKHSQDNPATKRVVRLENEEGMLNCLGFPFKGLDFLLKNLDSYNGKVPLSASIAMRPPKEGESMATVVEQFATMVDQIAKYVPSKVKMVEANFASPNTKGLTIFFEEGIFEQLAEIMISKLHSKGALLFIKMPPHLDDETRTRNLGVARRWHNEGGDGLTLINAIRVSDQRLSMGSGGKSGKPIYGTMLKNLADYRLEFEGGPIINAVGGITPERVPQVLMEGRADTVQILTPFIYYGPLYVRDAKTILLRVLKQKGFDNLEQVRDYNKT